MSTLVLAQLACATLLPALASYVLAKLEHLRSWSYWPWQILCGLVFGIIAVLGTEFGIATTDAIMNVRDAAPIAAGLFFGGPAGIIAGLIGGIERWFAALWGRGTFTRLACSLATCAAGIYAAVLRKYVFEGARPRWSLAFATGVVAEVLHLLLIFVTNPLNPTMAYEVVRACTVPMTLCNGLAAALSSIAVTLAEGRELRSNTHAPEISQVIQSRLLKVTAVGFVVSALLTAGLQGNLSQAKTKKLLSLALQDVQADIYKASDDNLLGLTRQVAAQIPSLEDATQPTIERLMSNLNVSEINVVNEQGIVVASSDQRIVGFDMASGEQSSEFLMLLPAGGAAQLVQKFQPMSFDTNVWRKYAGIRIEDGFVQVAYDTDHFMEDLSERIQNSVRNRHVGQNGALVVIAPNGALAGTRSDLSPTDADIAALIDAIDVQEERSVFTCRFMDTDYYASYRFVEWFILVSLESVEAAEVERGLAILVSSFMEVLVFAALFVAIYLLIRNEVVQSVWQVNNTLKKITEGDLQAEVTVRNSAEFEALSTGINATVASLREAIANEAARIDRELEYAREIQESALPLTFPPFPEIDRFDIYALMDAAREVGGDFYDFFLIDDHTLGLLIADVSGKGIPASLFMMAAKTELANYMSSGMPLNEAVQAANRRLCQSNNAGMFVTVWAATLDYTTGLLTYVNAGHNPPLLRHDGSWEWLRQRSGLFLGTFDTARYRSYQHVLTPDDELLLYTDGVTEAFSAQGEQYGEARLQAFAESHPDLSPHPMALTLRSAIARWAVGAEQSDDITILALEYGTPPQAFTSVTYAK
ncbi:MAG: SpoIIE family protein phosphatase [Atopobiaceae bacterium]|nr:SpoIIE family protein phosphatase [Atopobiaceae bacterium]